jgi:ketosteroid isomerase-like protein
MSQENVEVVRRAIDAFNGRDLDGVMRDTDSEVEVDWSRSRGVEAGIYCGRTAARGFWNTFLEMFDRVTVVPEEFIECDEHVLVPNTTQLWGRDGVKVEARSVSVATLRDGRIVQWRLYQEKAEALEAVGLAQS